MRSALLLFMLALPLKHLQVTSDFGNRVHPITGIYRRHQGVDLRADFDTVYAVMNSRVTAVSYDRLLGVYIKVRNGPFEITYGHLSQVLIMPTDSLNAGDAIAVSGSSGRVTGPHLHFAVKFNGRYIDPLAFLSAAYQKNINP
jgi:murein DD-endopeptidase MepM/ murein hydrolase activator NlpD